MNDNLSRPPTETRRRWGALVPGLLLVLFGVWFLLDNLGIVTVSIGQLWPIFPLLFGLAMLTGGATHGRRGRRDEGAVMVGTWATLIGLFFFTFTLGWVSWDAMAQLWPAFVLIGGLGFLLGFLASGLRDWGLFIVGSLAVAFGVLAFFFTFGVFSPTFAAFIVPYLGPIALIVGGIGLLLSALRRRPS